MKKTKTYGQKWEDYRMTEGDRRRKKIVECIENAQTPVSGAELAKEFGVSRQAIVQTLRCFGRRTGIF